VENASRSLVPVPSHKEVQRRDRVSLRAKVQDAVHHFTMLRRQEIYGKFQEQHGRPPTAEELDNLQPMSEEFDPVVELALIGIDYRNETGLRRQALAEAAQYLRPKLSAVAVSDDPDTLVEAAQKNELAKRLVGVMEALTQVKRTGTEEPESVPR
jgi:hypothetical protein